MVAREKHTNRSVYARVRIADRAITDNHAEKSFQAHGWHAEKYEDSYIITIHLYCARAVALVEARQNITSFCERYVPVYIDELRLLENPKDRRRVGSVSRASGGWTDLLPANLRNVRDISFNSVHWQVAVPRSVIEDPKVRREHEITTAERALEKSDLPGAPFDAETMKATTSIETRRFKANNKSARQKPANEREERPWYAVGAVSILLLVIFLAATGAGLLWLDLPVGVRIVGPVLAFSVAIVVSQWLVGNLSSAGVRTIAASFAVLFTFVLGYFIAIIVQLAGSHIGARVFWSVVVITLSVVLLVGWFHLANLYPNIRYTWLLPLITGLGSFAPSFWGIFSTWESVLGIPFDAMDTPEWFRFVISLGVTTLIAALVLFLGGVFGWASYFRIESGGVFLRAFMYFAALSVTLLLSFSTVLVIASTSHSLLTSWHQELKKGRTPSLSSSFIYRACIEPKPGTSTDMIETSSPIVVIEGRSQELWSWNISGMTGSGQSTDQITSPIDSEDINVMRVENSVQTCSR